MADHILVIDDELSMRELLGILLKRDGFQVTSCGTAEEGLEVVGTGSVDLVLTDLNLPGADGLEFMRRIRDQPNSEVRDVPVVLITAYGTAAGTARSLNTDLKALWPAPDSERDEVQRGRLQSKKKSLAIAHAIETGTPTTRRRLGEIFMKRVLDLPDFDVITAILEETGSRTFSDNHVKALTTEAISALESGGFSDEHRATLAEAARLIVDSA